MGSAVLQGVQELRFQTAKRSDMGCADLQEGRFGDCQDWHCHAANPSDMSIAIQQEGRFADAQE